MAHNYLHEMLPFLKEIDKKLMGEINDIFKSHDEVKHIRGGEVTKQKYKRGLK